MASSGPGGTHARARSSGARECERTPAEVRELKGDVTTLQVEVAGLKNDLANWTKTMEKRVQDHNSELDKNMTNFQVNATVQLSALKQSTAAFLL